MFSALPKTNSKFSDTFILLSADAFNLGKGENADYQHFVFSLNVFKKLLLQGHENTGLFTKLLTHSHSMTPFDKPFGNTVGKGEIAHNEQFLLFTACFLPVRIIFFHFSQI